MYRARPLLRGEFSGPGGGFLNTRGKLYRKRALEQSFQYVRQLEHKTIKFDPADPQTDVRVNHVRRNLLGGPKLHKQVKQDRRLPTLEEVLAPSFRGVMHATELPGFGSIEVHHGDCLDIEADCLVVPMVPNFLPYKGFPLEVMERGGPGLMKAAIAKLRADDEPIVPEIGDLVVLSAQEQQQQQVVKFCQAQKVAFLPMPYFFEGGSSDSARRLRFAVRKMFAKLQEAGVESVVMPNLGTGLFGYQPNRVSSVMTEQAFEGLLEIEEEIPRCSLKKIIFADKKYNAAELLSHALQDSEIAWQPEQRVTTATSYWTRKTMRLVALPRVFRVNKVKFKLHHGIKRNRSKHYEGAVRPRLWRWQRVNEPPPLMVNLDSGEPAQQQHAPNPYYARELSHVLTPMHRSGFHQMRITRRGKWRAVNGPEKMHEFYAPRL